MADIREIVLEGGPGDGREFDIENCVAPIRYPVLGGDDVFYIRSGRTKDGKEIWVLRGPKHRTSVDVFSLETQEEGQISVVRYKDYIELEDQFDCVYDDWLEAKMQLDAANNRINELLKELESRGYF